MYMRISMSMLGVMRTNRKSQSMAFIWNGLLNLSLPLSDLSVLAVQWFISRSVCLSIWASLAATSPQFLYLLMRVGECLCAIFRARSRNVASISCSLSLFVPCVFCKLCLGGSRESSMNRPLLLVLQGILGGSLSITAGSDANQKMLLRQISNDPYGHLLPIGLGDLHWVSFTIQFLSETCGATHWLLASIRVLIIVKGKVNKGFLAIRYEMTCSDREEKLHTYTYVYV